MIVAPQTLMTIFFVGIFIFMLTLPVLYFAINWKEIQLTRKANCLLWKHPENTPENISLLELVNIENPPGQLWPYKSFFFLSEKPLKWCYEKKVIKEGGEIEFTVHAFNPDEHIDTKKRTSASLASAIGWDWCKPILGRTSPLMEKVAQGGILIMGGASLFGIMALLDMLGKGG